MGGTGPPLTHHRDRGALRALSPSGTGSETFFRLRAAGYQGDLGKKGNGREPGPRRMVWNMTVLVCKGYQH